MHVFHITCNNTFAKYEGGIEESSCDWFLVGHKVCGATTAQFTVLHLCGPGCVCSRSNKSLLFITLITERCVHLYQTKIIVTFYEIICKFNVQTLGYILNCTLKVFPWFAIIIINEFLSEKVG